MTKAVTLRKTNSGVQNAGEPGKNHELVLKLRRNNSLSSAAVLITVTACCMVSVMVR